MGAGGSLVVPGSRTVEAELAAMDEGPRGGGYGDPVRAVLRSELWPA
jgi:hypothetical protein